MFRKTVSLLLAVSLAAGVSACGGESGRASGQQNSVSYVETEIGNNSGLTWPGGGRVNSKGQLVILDRGDGTNSGFVILDQDGKPAGQVKCSLPGNAGAFALDAQDNIYALTTGAQGGGDSQKLEVISPAGDILKTIDLGAFPVDGTGSGTDVAMGRGYMDIAVDSDGNIYLADPSKGVRMLDRDGKPVRTLGSQGCESIDVDSDGNIITRSVGMGKDVLERLDAQTGKSIWSIDLSQNSREVVSIGSNKVRVSKADKHIYCLDGQGITKYDSSGKPAGTAVDFRSYTILASGYNVSDMFTDASGNIYVTATSIPAGGAGMRRMSGQGGIKQGPANGAQSDSISGENSLNSEADSGPSDKKIVNGRPEVKYELYRYSVRSGDSTAQNQKVIAVSIPESNRTLEMAAAKFQRDNPGYRIDIQTYPDQNNNGGDYDTYVKNLNTQILSGKGPDIISVAGMPFDNYISRNILVNLSEMIANDESFDMSKYYTNIFDALKYNGNLYVLPTDFAFNVLMANQGVLDQESVKIDDSKWTWSDFKSIAEKVTKKAGNGNAGSRAALPSVSPDELLNLLTGGSYSNYLDAGRKSANFNSGGFIELLNTVKKLSDGSYTDSSVKTDMVSILEAAGRGSIVFYPDTIADYNMYGFMKSAFKDKLSLYSIPSAAGSDGGSFITGSLYAINRNSKYRPESWELLKELISDDVQASQLTGGVSVAKSGGQGTLRPAAVAGGFSVNRAAQQKKAQQAIDASQGGKIKMTMKSGSGSISLSPAPMSQSDIDYIDKFISRLKTYSNMDANISSILQDETKAFFSGAKSAEETAKLIQDRVNTYLGE
jgi:multiple sugar transport system substrate-binding protein